MQNGSTNKHKIFNDPIYGFITIPHDLLLDLIDHPYFQRLRRIKQLGLSHLVYPGALHTRFHHAVGAMHLMHIAIESIRLKGHEVTSDEALGTMIAILLHDVGHGPFSHALEHTIVDGVAHEDISGLMMERMNADFNGQLELGIQIFRNQYKKKFLHQLVSSQLDMDRLDYLRRDSFYTGVSEGVISSERIIKMLNVKDDELVIEQKGIYSIEKFLVARRLMYWQVYLHKTVVSAEFMLVNVLQRAKDLAQRGVELFGSPALQNFLYNNHGQKAFREDPTVLESFAQLDDYDIFGALKVWTQHSDRVLSTLSTMISDRRLFKVEIRESQVEAIELNQLQRDIAAYLNFTEEESAYFIINEKLMNNAYNPTYERIHILKKDNRLEDVATAADNLNISALSNPVTKYFLCYPKAVNN